MTRFPLPLLVSLRRGAAWIAVAGVLAASGGQAGRAASGFQPPARSAAATTAERTIAQRDLRTLVGYLASDDLAGRGVNHAGNDEAVRSIAERLEHLQLAPASPAGYRQEVPLVTSSLGPDTAIEITNPGRLRRWAAGNECSPVPATPAGVASGEIAYAGLGLVDPATGTDDYRALDVRGRLVVLLDRTARRPPRSSGRADFRRGRSLDDIRQRVLTAADRGAVAVLLASRDRHLDDVQTTWPSSPSIREATYHLAGDRLPVPVVRIGSALAEKLLGLDRDGAPVRSVADLTDRPDSRLPTSGTTARLEVDVLDRPVNAPNVLAWIPGADVARRAELLVLGAHLDHDGIDREGTIFNGADDDASGTAAVLEVAEAFASAVAQGWAPRRSVVFAFWNAEEKGLLGSTYYTKHVVPAGHRPVANLNLDMVGRDEDIPQGGDPRFGGLPPRSSLQSRRLVHILGYTLSPDLAAVVKAEGPALGLAVKGDYDRHPVNLLRRSDHWSFLRIGVPALFLTTGLHPDYHTPQDDVTHIDFDKLERVTRLAFRAAWRLAEADTPPGLAATPTPEP